MVSEETQSRPFILTVEFISFSKPHHFSSESGHKDVYPRGLLWKLLLLFSRSAVSNSLPLDRVQPTSSSVCGISQGRVLEWVATSFSRGSSRPQGGTQVTCICGQILYQGATREASLWALLEIKKENVGHPVGTLVRMWAKPEDAAMKGVGVMCTSVHLCLWEDWDRRGVERLRLRHQSQFKAVELGW